MDPEGVVGCVASEREAGGSQDLDGQGRPLPVSEATLRELQEKSGLMIQWGTGRTGPLSDFRYIYRVCDHHDTMRDMRR